MRSVLQVDIAPLLLQVTPSPILTEVAAGPSSSMAENLLASMILAIFGGIIALGASFLVAKMQRGWTAADREIDHIQKMGSQQATHVRDNVDRVWEASTRELDQIHEALKETRATLIDCQKGLLKVELRLETVEGFIETLNDTVKQRERARH